MAKIVRLKRGLDIQINGKAQEQLISENSLISDNIAIIPDHFHGIIPKMLVKDGDEVKAGSPLFYDKTYPEMNFVAPYSGTVLSVVRGDRRKVMSITIKRDTKPEYKVFKISEIASLTSVEIKDALLSAGLWPFIKQRPYDVIASPNQQPKAIYISTFDSAPLAPNYEFILKGQTSDFQAGIDALSKLTNAEVHLGIKAGSLSTDFRATKNVKITEFDGKHPAGNVGIQLHQTNPINKGEVVWTINVQDVLYIGRFFNKGIVDFTKTIALTGPEFTSPIYCKSIIGSSIQCFVKSNVSGGKLLRYISGNVLTGLQIEEDGYLDPYASQLTVMAEGAEIHELFGWAMPRFHKFSTTRLYFNGILESKLFQKLVGKIQYQYDARLLGGRRSIIMSGEYDKVLPMDILPEFLIKAMIAGNIDKMEALGAYEIAPEDVALCEFVCTSKLPLQLIVRNALDTMKKELE